MQSPDRVCLSIVVPMHNEEGVIGTFFTVVEPILEQAAESYEIVCVNDGSHDLTLDRLQDERNRNPRIKIVDLSRNYGKETALTAGIEHSSGDAIIPMDADLQDPPEVIPELVAKWREGFDMVLAIRSDRSSDTMLKRATSAMFYKLAGHVTETVIPANAGDFRLMDRRVVEALGHLPERTRFMKGMFAWLGFRQASVYYSRPPRVAGTTKWRYWKLWNFALEGIFSFSTLPLRIWTYVGVLTAAFSLVYASIIIIKTLVEGVDVPGYASLIVVMLFFSGIILIGLGVLGEYIGRIFIETKRRPIYLVRETIGFGSDAATLEQGFENHERRRSLA